MVAERGEKSGNDNAMNSPHRSGYAADVIAKNGVLGMDIHFLQKPFMAEDLSSKLREALCLHKK